MDPIMHLQVITRIFSLLYSLMLYFCKVHSKFYRFSLNILDGILMVFDDFNRVFDGSLMVFDGSNKSPKFFDGF